MDFHNLKKFLLKNTLSPLGFVFLLAYIGYGQLLDTNKVPFSTYSDIIAQHMGIKMQLYKSLTEKSSIPFWRDDMMSGVQIFTNPESQFTYPLHFLFFFLPPWRAVGPTIWLHFFIGGLILYFTGKTMNLGIWACLFMAAAQLFSFKLIAGTYAGFLPIMPMLILFPLLFVSFFYFIKQPNLKGSIAVAAASAICLNTGVFQLYYYSVLFLAGYFIRDLIVRLNKKQYISALESSVWIIVGVVLSAGIMAYHLLPLAAESSLLSRSEASYDFFLSGYTLTAKHLLTFLYPEALGTLFDVSDLNRYLWEDIAYFGFVPLCLAFFGSILGWRRPYTPLLIVSSLTTLFLSIDTPLLKLLYTILPGFGLFRIPNRFLYLTGFFGICLAGIGLESILFSLRKKNKYISNGLAFLLLAVVSMEGIYYSNRYITTKPANEVFPNTAYGSFFSDDKEIYRVAPLFRHTINYGWAALMELELVTGYTPFNLKHYQTYMDLLQSGKSNMGSAYSWADIFNITRWDLMDALNVKYMASPVPIQKLYDVGFAQTPDLEEVAHFKDVPMFFFFNLGMQKKDIYIYRNNTFRKRAFWVNELIAVENENTLMHRMTTNNLRDTALIVGDQNTSRESPIKFRNPREDNVTIVSASGGNLNLETQNRENRFLVISEIWHPGWEGKLNGKPLTLHKTNAALMGAWIPKGKHHVALSFRPLLWKYAIQISGMAVTLFLCCLAILIHGKVKSLIGGHAIFEKNKNQQS